ncbi:hypothetical protein GCM10023320_32300 [Pseudonocardia adelaidensis]|uniref:DDE family transposase n=1 Tax=Pseudonocardia adelaidensis TaxID=648754 RepID=A0ABP9NJ66_9PSEU
MTGSVVNRCGTGGLQRCVADKTYSSRANRPYLRQRKITATIPVKADQAANEVKKGSRGGCTSPRSTSGCAPWPHHFLNTAWSTAA